MTRLGIGRPRWPQLVSAWRLWRHPRRSRRAILDFQRRRLGELLRWSGSRVSFHGQRFRERGVELPAGADPLTELAKLPPVSKLELREQPEGALLAAGARVDRLSPHRTSGTTGIKLFLWRDAFEDHLLQLFRYRAWLDHGVRPGQRLVHVHTEFSHRGASFWLTGLRERVGAFRVGRVSNQQEPEEVLRQLEALSPDVLIAYPSVLSELVRITREKPRRPLRPKLVLTGGEMLLEPARALIEETFASRVFGDYGAMELNLLAWECRATGRLHACDDALVLEVLDAAGRPVEEGETGEVVVTGLHGYTMPLIRYRTGDLAVRGPAPCPCGAPFATLEAVRGRTVESYDRPDGGTVHHWRLSTALLTPDVFTSVHRYQIVQETERRVVFRVVLLRQLTAEQEARMRAAARRLLGPEMELEIRRESHIPISRSGKMLQSRNLLREARHGSPWDPAHHDPVPAL